MIVAKCLNHRVKHCSFLTLLWITKTHFDTAMPFWNFCCYYFVFWLQPSASCKKWGLLLPFLQCNKILLKIMIIFHNIFSTFCAVALNYGQKWIFKVKMEKNIFGAFHCRTILSISYEKMWCVNFIGKIFDTL